MKTTLKNTAGMSLVEVMLAAGTLATALSLLFGSLMSIAIIGEISEETVAAQLELGSVMEDLNELTSSNLMTYNPPNSDGLFKTSTVLMECYLADGTAVPIPLPAGQAMPALPSPVEVKVTFAWQNDTGHVFQVSAARMIGG